MNRRISPTIESYLDRIGYTGRIEPDIATLTRLHEAHVFSVPFENLDVQLGRPVTTRVEDAYEKIVLNARGGWCYEQNGLFGWALANVGFDVTRIAANVMRAEHGEDSAASHLCLLVRTPASTATYLVDVGFGGSMIKPIALINGQHDQPPFKLGLQPLTDGYWRFWEDMGGGKFSYDFTEKPASEDALAAKSEYLQNDPSSNFVLSLVAQRRSRDRHRVLRGRVFTNTGPGGAESITLDSPDALVSILRDEFRLDVAGVAELWPRITARHDELFSAD